MAGMYETIPLELAYPRALAAAERAIDIDPDLGAAHTSLGWIRAMFEWDLQEAQRELDLGVRLDPGYADGYHWAAVWRQAKLGAFGAKLMPILQDMGIETKPTVFEVYNIIEG